MKFILCLLLLTSFIYAQSVSIRGTIIDEETQEALVAANLQIKNTYRGTITNENGQFILEVENFPVTVQVTYIGYARKEITLEERPQKSLLIELKPVVLETEAIVVTAENPAMVIMRKVIANKQLMNLSQLDNMVYFK